MARSRDTSGEKNWEEMWGVEVSRDWDIRGELSMSRGAAREEPELETVLSVSSSEKQSMEWREPRVEDMCGGGVLGGVACSWCSSCRRGWRTLEARARKKERTGTRAMRSHRPVSYTHLTLPTILLV